MDHVTFWIAAIVVPIVLLIGNALFRHHMDMPQSAGADTGLMFVAFDLTVMFRKAVYYPPFSASLTGIFVLMLLFDVGCWAYLVKAEKTLDEYHHVRSRRGRYPLAATILSMLLPFTMIVLNLAPFAYGGPLKFLRVFG
jgi:hypothetical protein